jgi:sterol desaturase/sphingolipid hydroxylase (fatty acid hydroxylase superfamily)
MGWVETLQKLRLLPPPANELVPLLSTNGVFILLTLTVDDFQGRWKSLLEPYETSNIFVYGCFGVYMTMYWGYSLLVHVAEHSIPRLVHFKIQPTTTTPWSEVLRMVPLVLFNQVCVGIPLLKFFFLIYVWRVGGGGEDQVVTAAALQVPSMGRFAVTLLVHVLCTEVWFYGMHRLLHSNRFLYSNVHALHHSYKAPSCLESAYVHPVEFSLNSFTVFFIGILVTGAPLILCGMWLWTVTFLQVHDHSGYWLPFLPSALMHDYHHQAGTCCYGVLGMIDGILKTEGNFQAFVQEKRTATLENSKQK